MCSILSEFKKKVVLRNFSVLLLVFTLSCVAALTGCSGSSHSENSHDDSEHAENVSVAAVEFRFVLAQLRTRSR
ncbi:MAG: hypothetical protein Q4F00_06840 [bacterium]|nr:hypothetical protein [bacterium]